MQLPFRNEDSNKATFGNVLNVAGSYNYRGAAVLSSLAALRVGAGYSTLAAISPVIEAAAAQTPDLVFLPLENAGHCIAKEAVGRIAPRLVPGTVVALGCGISAIGEDREEIGIFVRNFLEVLAEKDVPTVLDADGLNLLSEMESLPKLPSRLVMTPHPKECSRLLGTTVEEVQKDRMRSAYLAASKFHATVVLKGHRTVVGDESMTFENDSGNSALAKAGTGDVLTGTIAGLLAQGMTPFNAAALGVRLHGIAGELASKDLSEYGVLASDLLRYLPLSIRALSQEN